MGRPRRALPPYTGILPDESVAYLCEQRGETPTTGAGVKYLRDAAGLPPTDERFRAAWFARRGIDPETWQPPAGWPDPAWDGEP